MNLKNQPPIFVPNKYQDEIEQMPKAALMDLVWDLATVSAVSGEISENVMLHIRRHRDVVLLHRKQDKGR